MNQDKKHIISQYISKGLSVIPIRPNDKIPLESWDRYQRERAGENEVNSWLEKWPNMNVGIVTGKISNLVVFDIDPRHGGDPSIFRKYRTVECLTGGNGVHFYFKYPAESPIKSKAGVLPGVDVRADGGLVVAPPSIHSSGRKYTWNLEAGREVKPLPSELIEMINGSKSGVIQKTTFDSSVLGGVSEGGRNNTAASVIGKILKRYYEGEWESEAWPLVMAWNEKNNPPLSVAELRNVFDSIEQRERKSKLTNRKDITDNSGDSLPRVVGDTFFSFAPRLITELSSENLIADWIWEGYIARGHITLLSALWKAGKSTLISYLLRSLQDGSPFLNQQTKPTKILILSEESESIWYRRRVDLEINASVWLSCRPVKQKLVYKEWVRLLVESKEFCLKNQIDLVIIDTLSGFWSVQDENDASVVGAALLPLNAIVESHIGVLLIHHFRKSGGSDGTAARGSGALSSFADIIVDFTRLENEGTSTRRVLKALSRFDETPQEVVIELGELGYDVVGTKADVVKKTKLDTVIAVLKGSAREMTAKEILEHWPSEGRKPGLRSINNYIRQLLSNKEIVVSSERVIGKNKTAFYGLPGNSESKENATPIKTVSDMSDQELGDIFGGEVCRKD